MNTPHTQGCSRLSAVHADDNDIALKAAPSAALTAFEGSIEVCLPEVPPHRDRDHLSREPETSERGAVEAEVIGSLSRPSRSVNVTAPARVGSATRRLWIEPGSV